MLLTVLSLIGVFACNYFYYYAVQHTSLTHVAVLYALGPIMTAILAFIFLKEPIRSGRLLGIFLAFVGVALLITNGRISEFLRYGFHVGDASELISALCLAIYTVAGKHLKNTPSDCATFWMMLISFVITLPIVLLGEGFPTDASVQAIASVCYLGVACSGIGYLLQQTSIRQIGASASAAFLNGISPITILTAALVLKENVTVFQALCMIIVFIGLCLNVTNRSVLKFFSRI